MTTTYEWDPAKAERNAKIHGVTFEQATVALEDIHAVYLPTEWSRASFGTTYWAARAGCFY